MYRYQLVLSVRSWIVNDLAVMISSTTTLLGVGLGAWLAHYFGKRRSIELRRVELLEEAMSAAYRLQAARHYPTGVPDEILVTTQHDVEAFNREIRAEGVRSFIEAASECRMSLAAVTPFCPPVKPYWDAFELRRSRLTRSSKFSENVSAQRSGRSDGLTPV